MRLLAALAALALWPSAGWAGPPYETDDPDTTDFQHWEIYAFGSAEGRGRHVEGNAGLDVNYGLASGVQLTATLPLEFERGSATGPGDIELGVKLRFLHDEHGGFSAAVFPRLFLPSGAKPFTAGRAGLLLPLWLGKDWGGWSVFGGGGYMIQPGRGNRSHALAALAVTRDLSDKVALGVEAKREGPDAPDGRATTLFQLGGILQLGGPFSLLAAGGPLLEDGGGRARWHGYAALGLNL